MSGIPSCKGNSLQKSTSNENLLRNEIRGAQVAEYFERGKPTELVEHGLSNSVSGQIPFILRPDLLITEDGFALTNWILFQWSQFNCIS